MRPLPFLWLNLHWPEYRPNNASSSCPSPCFCPDQNSPVYFLITTHLSAIDLPLFTKYLLQIEIVSELPHTVILSMFPIALVKYRARCIHIRTLTMILISQEQSWIFLFLTDCTSKPFSIILDPLSIIAIEEIIFSRFILSILMSTLFRTITVYDSRLLSISFTTIFIWFIHYWLYKEDTLTVTHIILPLSVITYSYLHSGWFHTGWLRSTCINAVTVSLTI